MTEQQAEPNKWTEIVRDDPAHSHRYVERFRTMKAEGHDLAGEARLIDAWHPALRGSSTLDVARVVLEHFSTHSVTPSSASISIRCWSSPRTRTTRAQPGLSGISLN